MSNCFTEALDVNFVAKTMRPKQRFRLYLACTLSNFIFLVKTGLIAKKSQINVRYCVYETLINETFFWERCCICEAVFTK